MRMGVIEWLLDSDPSIRWQVMRDLIAEPDAAVASERSRVAEEGWGARLLDLQAADGHWGGAALVPHAWISTMDTLQLLRDLGVDPASDRVRRAIGQVRDRAPGARSSRTRRSSKAKSSPASTAGCSPSVPISAKPAIVSSTGCSRSS